MENYENKVENCNELARLETTWKDSEQSREEEYNARLPDLVISKIFEYFETSASLEDFKSFRALGKLWNAVTLSKWRSVTAIRLGEEQQPVSPAWSKEKVKKCLGLSTFLNSAHDPNCPFQFGNQPFSSYIIYKMSFWNIPDLSRSTLDALEEPPKSKWTLFAELNLPVDFFKFEDCHFSDDGLEIENIFNSQALANITKMVFAKNNVSRSAEWKNMPEKYDLHLKRDLARTENYKSGFTPFFPKLTHLELSGEVPINSSLLLCNSPNLETIEILKSDVHPMSYHKIHPVFTMSFDSLFQAYKIKREKTPYKIIELDVMESHFFTTKEKRLENKLRALSLPLETLTLKLQPHAGGWLRVIPPSYMTPRRYEVRMEPWDITNIFIPILRVHNNTLKTLKVFRPPVYPFYGYSYPEMSCLESFYVWGSVVQSFSFLEKMPQLKLLYINTHCVDKSENIQELFVWVSSKIQINMLTWLEENYDLYGKDMLERTPPLLQQAIRLNHMENLHLDCKISCNLVKLLASWMPNLKTFKGNFNKDTFRAVCKWLPTLEELRILFLSNIDDETITGRASAEENINPDNIMALTGLKRFFMEGLCDGGGNISDWSLNEGFLKMPSLQVVHLFASGPEQISETAEETLRKQVKDVSIVQWNPKHFHKPGGQLCTCQLNHFVREVLTRQNDVSAMQNPGASRVLNTR